MFLARMTAHEIDNITSRFPESLIEAQTLEINEKAITNNTKKATKFGLDISKHETIVTFQICVQISKHGIKIQRLQFLTSLIHWLVYANAIIHRSGGE